MLRVMVLALLAIGGLASPAFAQRNVPNGGVCQGLADIPTGECYGRESEKVDKEIQAFLQKVEGSSIDPDARDQLKWAQNAWTQYRDLTCAADSRAYFGAGSPGGSTEYSICLYSEARLRLQDLHTIYDWAERPDR